MITYPINLLLKGKRCLIVGGGKVAARKLNSLLEAEADVTLVAPEICEAVSINDGRFELKKRKFRNDDLNGVFLVYLVTGDRALNKSILQIAQSLGILVCSADVNWQESSFITPARIRCADTTIAVSSNGVACRKTKLIKDNLARHLAAIENTELIVLGTDHLLLGINRREGLHLNGSHLGKAGEKIMTLWGIHEFMLLNTCNRIELTAVGQPENTTLDMLKLILGMDNLENNEYYLKTGFAAFEHLSRVTAGLRSQIIGENHITAQFKAACQQSIDRQWAGSLLSSLKDDVLHVSKHLRNEIPGIQSSSGIEELTIDYLHEKLTNLDDKTVVLAGSGEVGRRMHQLLAAKGCSIEWFYHSSRPESTDKTVKLLPLDHLPERLSHADIAIMALAVDRPVITAETAGKIKNGCEIVDLGTPRNVAPELRDYDGLFNITDPEILKERQRDTGYARQLNDIGRIIEEHKDIYERFKNSFIDGRQRQ